MFGKLFGKKPTDIDELAAQYRELKLEGEAIDKIVAHLSAAPDDEGHWVGVAIELRQIGFDRCCEATYATALRRFPRSHRLYGNQGVLFRSQKRFDEAIASLEKALALKPDYQIAMHNLANTYELSGKFSDGLLWYGRALKANPDDAPSCNGAANCFAALGDAKAAFEFYEKAIALDPSYAEPEFNWIIQLVRQGERSEAAQRLAAFVRRWPDDTQARDLLATLRDETQSLPQTYHAYVPDRQKIVVRPIDNTDYENRGSTAKPTGGTAGRDFVSFDELAKMSREEAVALGQVGAWDKAHLWDMVKERLETTSPPEDTRIFLSYRRESDAHLAWMRKLADALDERGYDVMLDQFVRGLTQSPSVPEMISMMASCTVFSPILTDGYFERIDPGDGPTVAHAFLKDGWVFDEYQVAMFLGQRKRLVVTGLWRSGRLRPPFTTDNTLDLRDDAQMAKRLDRSFPHRKLMVVGMRGDQMGRAMGPLRFSQVDGAIETLQDTRHFTQIVVINGAEAAKG